MTLQYGTAATFSATLAGPFGNSGTGAKVTSVTAPAEGWKGAVSPYSQVVAVEGVSLSSKVDLQLSPEQLQKLHDRSLAFTTENDGGVVTIFAIGDRPEEDLTFQATLTEVTA